MASPLYLQAMGIPVWKSRRLLPFAKNAVAEHIEPESFSAQNANEVWADLQLTISTCLACELSQTRKSTVFGSGDAQADWMIIGDAPDEDEELAAEPFVNDVGLMLGQMLLAIGVQRKDVFITNIVKCRTPENRDPKKEEIAQCHDYLVQQMKFVNPKVILAIGRIAAQNLLKTKETISHIRGNIYQFGEAKTPLIATFHPAYLMRSPTEKSKAWIDLVAAKKQLEEAR